MPILPALRKRTTGLKAPEMLRFILTEAYPGKAVVTASLRAPSIVVLKMVADAAPATPVLFCQRGPELPESNDYCDAIVARLGLTNVSVTSGDRRGDVDGSQWYTETMWVTGRDGIGRTREIVHLENTLEPYDCWISAVYHVMPEGDHTNRLDISAGKIRIDALRRRDAADIDRFMREHDLPFHPMAHRTRPRPAPPLDAPVGTYHF